MLTETPIFPKPSTCGLCEFSIVFRDSKPNDLVCCTKYETHIDPRQGICTWYDNLHDIQRAHAIKEIVHDWLQAQAIVESGDLRSMECIVRQRRHQTGRRLSFDDQHYSEDHPR